MGVGVDHGDKRLQKLVFATAFAAEIIQKF
jgi:hypothetical protein